MPPLVRFATTPHGRVAYATHGEGPALICAPWWVSHVEQNWEEPAFRDFFSRLAEHFTVVRYDRPGVGLSDRDRAAFTLEAETEVLGAMVDHLGFEAPHFFSVSCGGPPTLLYAARNPTRVGKIALYASYVRGAAIASGEMRAALTGLVRASWGIGSKTIADMFSPELTAEQSRRMAKEHRASASGDAAARLLGLTFDMDVTEAVDSVTASVCVMHRRQDRTVAFELGRDLAARLADATLLPLEGKSHAPWLGDTEPLLEALLQFYGAEAPRRAHRDNTLCREGDVWTLVFAGQERHLKHSKGLSDLATLIANAGRPVSAAALMGEPETTMTGGADDVLDDQARADFRRRLDGIEAELAEAEGNADAGRIEKLRDEHRLLVDELRTATGLGGRRRKLNDPGERARKAVTARIRDAIAKIDETLPAAAEHLRRAISTGVQCSYAPESEAISVP